MMLNEHCSLLDQSANLDDSKARSVHKMPVFFDYRNTIYVTIHSIKNSSTGSSKILPSWVSCALFFMAEEPSKSLLLGKDCCYSTAMPNVFSFTSTTQHRK